MEDSKESIESVERVRQLPTKHNEHSLTEKQQVFADELAAGASATDAVLAAYWDQVLYPSQFGHKLKNKPQIQAYLMETAQLCAEIQMEMITNKKTPAAVRMDGIKDRLNRAWIVQEEEKTDTSVSIGDIVINLAK